MQPLSTPLLPTRSTALPTDATETPEAIIETLARKAKAAAAVLACVPAKTVNDVLFSLAAALREHKNDVLEANQIDVAAARAKALSPALVDRLTLDPARIEAMAKGVEAIAALDDPVGKTLAEWDRPNGLSIRRVSVPLGVLGMIYESRPNVTIDAAALCLKSHNAVILRGGTESFHSSHALHSLIETTLQSHHLPPACVAMVPSSDRALVGAMLTCDRFIDVMIPRGGKGLTDRVMKEARMPVFAHLEGICHVYIHPSANPDIARNVTLNAKMRRTGICGAAETLLLDSALDPGLARQVIDDLISAGCTLYGDDAARKLDPRMEHADEQSWRTEYLDAKMNVRVVSGVEDAIAHINAYGSHHTESILAQDAAAVRLFQDRVDSAIVMHNASTQFADGGEFGMGAEIGIATGKFHARGPVGVEQLTTYKYLVCGNGQTRAG